MVELAPASTVNVLVRCGNSVPSSALHVLLALLNLTLKPDIMSTAKFRAAAVHAAPVYMDKHATLKKVVDLIKQAGEEDIKLHVTAEAQFNRFIKGIG